MIRRVTIRRFKRFDEVTVDLPGHVVLAGPNNLGKTTVLQAIAAWGLAFEHWKTLNARQRHKGAYPKAPMARQAFAAVPLRSFDLLWLDRSYRGTVEIELTSSDGWTIAMELIADSTEQVYMRPRRDVPPEVARSTSLATVYVPAMSGLATEEPVYQRPKIVQLLGQARPGEVLRNLLLQAHQLETAWRELGQSIHRLFGYELLPPKATGPDIVAEYRTREGGPSLDIASAGSGFQQVLMLLTFLLTRPASVLLLDEPDAHLHVILQQVIYDELRSLAARQRSQLIMATHSEVIIDSVDPRELCAMYARPRMLADSAERTQLIRGLGVLSNTDIMLAEEAVGVLYVEGYTDLDLLREWARVLGHPAFETLSRRALWRPTVWEPLTGAAGVKARDHYEALQLVRPGLPGLILLDGDDRSEIPDTPLSGAGLQRLRWRRYEAESYLLYPMALARFVRGVVGSAADLHVADLERHFAKVYPPAFREDPFADLPFLKGTKARTELLPPALAAAGLPELHYTRYHEIAAVMRPDEIHPEVVEKLDGIQKAFGL